MNRPLRIAIADANPTGGDFLRQTLAALGHRVVGPAGTGQELLALCASADPQVALTAARLPGMDGIEAAEFIRENHPLPVILLADADEPELVRRAAAAGVAAYLVKPVSPGQLGASIALGLDGFGRTEALRGEAARLRQALADREVIERARGVLMRRTGLDEPAAFRRLQRLASEKNCKLVDLARMILLGEEALRETAAPEPVSPALVHR